MEDLDYRQLNDNIHSRLRLSIFAVLFDRESAEFVALKNYTRASDGNLSINLRKLVDAGYLTMEKMFRENKPVTKYSITEKGKRDFEIYLTRLEKFIRRKNQ